MEILKNRLRRELKKRKPGVDKFDGLWDAAVLIPFVYSKSVLPEIELLFEVRGKNLKRQPGEICFPGGSFEEKDCVFEETAVRETCEELGLGRGDIEIWGELDTFITHMGPVIHPFVGTLKNTEKIRLSKEEVSEIFTVPLDFFLNTEPEIHEMELGDRPLGDFPSGLAGRENAWRTRKKYRVYFYKYGKYVIWGMTARILYAFLNNFQGALK